MGITTVIFVADLDGAKRMREDVEEDDDEQADEFPSDDCFKNLLEVDFDNLERIIDSSSNTKCRTTEEAGTNFFVTVQEFSKDGPWIFAVPRSLRDKAAGLTDDKLRSVAQLWAETASLKMMGYRSSEALESATSFRNLAIQAVSSSKDLFMWISV